MHTTDGKKEEMFAYFIRNLTSDNPSLRWGAAHSLGRMNDSRAIVPLIVLLKDPDWRVRFKAVWALGQLGDASVLPFLLRLSNDESDTVRDSVIEAKNDILRRSSLKKR
ncbi:HEAT repeat domain-containing protein [Methanogenium marinum]|uniref:HEAT repeat domain-containing protein n=1 Tax=Methanogenium marinum TaxID=348610 RepID=A0A9Q4KRM9_9EURY|nr:HEAT repeat domain-containing protein [Methanogenium marinum]MDE4907201.1 HEAT repeat domain-containing protein [Methanogenium marinum]